MQTKYVHTHSSSFLNEAKGVNAGKVDVVYVDYTIHIKLRFTVLEKKGRE